MSTLVILTCIVNENQPSNMCHFVAKNPKMIFSSGNAPDYSGPFTKTLEPRSFLLYRIKYFHMYANISNVSSLEIPRWLNFFVCINGDDGSESELFTDPFDLDRKSCLP